MSAILGYIIFKREWQIFLAPLLVPIACFGALLCLIGHLMWPYPIFGSLWALCSHLMLSVHLSFALIPFVHIPLHVHLTLDLWITPSQCMPTPF